MLETTPQIKEVFEDVFGKEKRSEILRRNPLSKVTEVVKEIAKCWGEMSKEDKHKYKEAAKRGKF